MVQRAGQGDKYAELATLLGCYAMGEGTQPTAIPALQLFRATRTDIVHHEIYEPSLCLVAQGSKIALLGDETLTYAPGHFLLVSISMPLTTRISEASPTRPYLALKIALDPSLITDVLAKTPGVAALVPGVRRGLSAGVADPLLRDAATRLVRLLDTPQHIPVLAPLILRELAYLLLVGDDGAVWRATMLATGPMQRIARIIGRLRREFDRPLRVDALAAEAAMSVSSLHAHFKAATAMSPLQYLKQVRLQEARDLLLREHLDAAEAGSRVGYDSPSQFSRDYRRLFGAPPGRDVARLRAGGDAAGSAPESGAARNANGGRDVGRRHRGGPR